MRYLFAEVEIGLSPDRIEELEGERGMKLPADFRTFLQEVNGGWLRRSAEFDFGEGHVTAVRSLFGFNGNPCRDVPTIEGYRDSLPPCLLPIGDDVGGADLFVLDLRPESLGRVYIRAINVPPNLKPFLPASLFLDSDDLELYHHVADSFSEFIDLIAGAAA